MTDILFWHGLQAINLIALIYFVILNLSYLVASFLAFFYLRKYALRMKFVDMNELIHSAGAPPITLLAPAFNEEATCVEAIRSLLTLKYPQYDIIVINDGSKDETLNSLIQAFDLDVAPRAPVSELKTAPIRAVYHSQRHPNLWVIDKENGGKADSLNAGINYCRTPLFCAIDADTLLERDALIRIVRPFLEDRTTVAAGGIIRIVNDCAVRAGMVTNVQLPRNWLARFQVLEYLRAFLAGRMGWDVMKSTLVISGAFGVFKRSIVVDAGGYSTDTVGEDMELVVRLHRHCREGGIPYHVTFVPDPVAWTECPETLQVLGRQRDRWQRGLIESLTRHIRMLFNPRYGRIGLFAFPYFFFLEMLGPVVEFAGYISFTTSIAFGTIDFKFALAFFLAAFVLGIVLSVSAVCLEELSYRRYNRLRDLLYLFALSIIENFGYRQMSQYWRFRGTLSKLLRRKGWGKMERKGFATENK